MTVKGISIRSATPEDAAAIAALYAHHVRNGTATFETEPPSLEETRARVARVLDAGWPWLVAHEREALLGYAYASQFRDRAAYRYTCENSIYLAHDRLRRGIGSALLAALLPAAEAAGFRQMLAVIADGPSDSGAAASVRLHARHGFVERGRMHATGRKHGRWLDTLYMQRALGEGSTTPPPAEP